MSELNIIEFIKKAYESTRGYWGDVDVPEGMEFSVEEEGEYDGADKYQYKEDVLKINGKFYSAIISRCGSHFTDWDKDLQDVYQVKRVEKTIVQVVWEEVK